MFRSNRKTGTATGTDNYDLNRLCKINFKILPEFYIPASLNSRLSHAFRISNQNLSSLSLKQIIINKH